MPLLQLKKKKFLEVEVKLKFIPSLSIIYGILNCLKIQLDLLNKELFVSNEVINSSKKNYFPKLIIAVEKREENFNLLYSMNLFLTYIND